MRILLLTQILPYPPDAGPRTKTWHVLRYLVAQGHQVTLASFVRPDEEQHIPVLEKICERVVTVPIRRSRVADVVYWFRSHLTGRPFLVERDDISLMRKCIGELMAATDFDIFHADQLTMAQFALPPTNNAARPRRVFDAHNATWTILERMRDTAPWFLKPVLSLEMNRVRRYEGVIIRDFEHTLAVTEIDRQALMRAANGDRNSKPASADRISVAPITVDTAKLPIVKRESVLNNILTLGTLHYAPNADGIRWFVQHVFPVIRQTVPDATLTIVGKNPPADFRRLAARLPEAITVTGYVPDLLPYLERTAVVVVPVLAGSGMRVRILEALSRGLPVITTSIGLEGIEARHREEVIVADTARDFASAVEEVLKSPALQDRLSANGRRLAVGRYDWQVALKQMDVAYRSTTGRRARSDQYSV